MVIGVVLSRLEIEDNVASGMKRRMDGFVFDLMAQSTWAKNLAGACRSRHELAPEGQEDPCL